MFSEISEQLNEYLMQFEPQLILEIAGYAMDMMQQWGGRSHTACWMIALNAREIEEGKWQYPDPQEVRKDYGYEEKREGSAKGSDDPIGSSGSPLSRGGKGSTVSGEGTSITDALQRKNPADREASLKEIEACFLPPRIEL